MKVVVIGATGCDVLVMGGGIAGLMAAIAAADDSANVVIAEKAHTKRSGCGATGSDHFKCYIPEVHGTDLAPIVKE
jgi:succinate dehydrogenase/fumarate reductase flavoprotein subunit